MPWLGGPIRYTPTVWSFDAVTKSIKKVILRRTNWNHSQTKERERDLHSYCEFLSEDVPLVHQSRYPFKPNIPLQILQTDLHKFS